MLGRREFLAGIASVCAVSGCVQGSESSEDDRQGETVPDESEAEGSRFAVYVIGDGSSLVATEEYVEPGSVSRRAEPGGGYRVEFELTEGAVRALEDAVNKLDRREDGEITIEFDGEEVFSGRITPSLWEDIRSGEYSEGTGGLSVTGLNEVKADELVEVLSGS